MVLQYTQSVQSARFENAGVPIKALPQLPLGLYAEYGYVYAFLSFLCANDDHDRHDSFRENEVCHGNETSLWSVNAHENDHDPYGCDRDYEAF